MWCKETKDRRKRKQKKKFTDFIFLTSLCSPLQTHADYMYQMIKIHTFRHVVRRGDEGKQKILKKLKILLKKFLNSFLAFLSSPLRYCTVGEEGTLYCAFRCAMECKGRRGSGSVNPFYFFLRLSFFPSLKQHMLCVLLHLSRRIISAKSIRV